MFSYPYLFWMVALSFTTPIVGTLLGWAYTRWSNNRHPLWITLPGYFITHMLGLFAGHWCGLDYDYLKYQSDSGTVLWKIAYRGHPVLSLLGLAILLWIGIRRGERSIPRGFDVFVTEREGASEKTNATGE